MKISIEEAFFERISDEELSVGVMNSWEEELDSAGNIMERLRFVLNGNELICVKKYPDENKEERSRTIQEAMKIYKQLKRLWKDVQWIREDATLLIA